MYDSILVTGGCGFIGSNVLNYLMTKYPSSNFVNIDRLDYCASTSNVINDTLNYTFIHGNICDEALLSKTLEQYSIDCVAHFAAQSHVDNSFAGAKDFIKDNINGTYTLLESCRRYGKLKKFIHVSTDEVYGEVKHDMCDETYTLSPSNPYSVSKVAAEYFVKAYHQCYGIPAVITRGNNVYGPRQFPEKLIPKFLLKLFNGEKCTIHGTGEPLRNFVHSSDVARAFETLINLGEVGMIYNIGTSHEYSVMDVTSKLIAAVYPGDNIDDHITYVEDRPWNDCRYAIDSTKLKDLGWSEQVPFLDGLKETIDWYKSIDVKEHWGDIEQYRK